MSLATHPQPGQAFVRNAEVIHSHTGDAIVALDIASGSCFAFEGPSRRIWELLETPASASDLVRQLVTEFDVDGDACLRETVEYLAGLEAEGLVQRAPAD